MLASAYSQLTRSLARKGLGRAIFQARRSLLTLSAVEGPLEPPLSTLTLSEYFRSEILANHYAQPALIAPQEKVRPHGGPLSRNMNRTDYLAWDFEELNQHVEALARGLVALGVTKGDRIAVIMGNNSAYATLQWASARIGAILVTLNPAYRPHEFVAALNTVGASTLVIVPTLRYSNYTSVLSSALPSLVSAKPGDIHEETLPALRRVIIVDNTSGNEFLSHLDQMKSAIDFRELLMWQASPMEDKKIEEIMQTMDKDDVINLQFTSGTTGSPKAVSLTSQLLNNGLSIGRCMNLAPGDKLCNVPPLFHCFGLVLGNLAAWVHGACIVYPSELFDPRAIVDALQWESCTALHGVPTHFLGVLEEVARRGGIKFPRLRTGIAAGSPIPEELMRQLIEKLNLTELTIAYGMTETSPVSFQTVPVDPIKKRIETVGRVQPHVKAKVINEDGNTVPVGTPGELCVAGYLVQKGYWNNPEQTMSVMKHHPGSNDLWMYTGDEVIMDEEGYLRVISRIKDIIIRGGENLFPVQIENTITDHHAIREAAAVAVPDLRYGEVVGIWIVRNADAPPATREQIRQWVGEKMNPQNRPVWVWFVGEDGVEGELPKTLSGKVQKHILREWAKNWAAKGVGKSVTFRDFLCGIPDPSLTGLRNISKEYILSHSMKRANQSATSRPSKKRKMMISEDGDLEASTSDIIVAASFQDRPHSAGIHILKNVDNLRNSLLAWFDTVRDVRGMPWRQPISDLPEMRAQRAYEVWVSEIMLQQTQVATVIPYYRRWMEKFPTVQALATSDIDTVNSLWRGLGYYSRAARLLSGAKKVVNEYEGRLPADVKVLQKEIPGIGRYSAGAICSIAYGVCAPVLDGNVHRLLSRILAIHASPKAKKVLDLLWAAAEDMVQDSYAPGDVNQALIELGSTVCKVKDPNCESCPLKAGCGAYQELNGARPVVGDIEDLCQLCEPISQGDSVTRFPMKAVKKQVRVETDVVSMIEWRGNGERHFILVRRPEGGLLAGLYEFPSVENVDENRTNWLDLPYSVLVDLLAVPPPKGRGSAVSQDKLRITDMRDLGRTVHVFSHIKKTYQIMSVIMQGGAAPPPLQSTHDVSAGNRGARVKWVPEGEVMNANIGTGVLNVWKRAVSYWNSIED